MTHILSVAKRVLVCVLCFAFLLSLSGVYASAASVYVRPQKHIYLVLDDSGSMSGEPEYDANYALQTLVAMTDKTDTINIYFLNNSSKIDGQLDLLNKSDALINTVKVEYPESTGSTPYSAVSKAQKDLKNKVSADDEGEYWLIVVTDGGFTYPAMDYGQDLADFAATQLKNGKYPQVMTVSINGFSVISGDARNADNVFCIENNDVIPSMNEAARAISNRVEITDYTLSADGTTLDFTTPYPASNIIVLAQNIQTTITEYTCGSKLNTTEQYTVSHPMPTPELDTSTVFFITEESGKSIMSGPITLKFNDAVYAENLVILVEPAIGLMARYYDQDGSECDPGDLMVGENAKVVFTICDPATQQPIDENSLEGDVVYSVDINGQHYEGSEVEFKIDAEDITIDMFAEFSDGFVLDIHNTYHDLKEFRIVSMTLSEGGKFTRDINTLSDADVVTATVRVNGSPMKADEFTASTFEIRGGSLFTSRFEVTADANTSTYTIQPKGGLFKVVTPQTVEVDVVFSTPKGEVVTERLIIELTGPRNWLPLIIGILGLALLIYLIWVYSVKPKFPLDLKLQTHFITDGKPAIPICTEKSLFSHGVLDWKSAMPFPGPFVINLSAVDGSYGGLKLEATKSGKILVVGIHHFGDGAFNYLPSSAPTQTGDVVKYTSINTGYYNNVYYTARRIVR